MATAARTMAGLGRRAVLAMAASAVGCGGGAAAEASVALVDLAIVDRETGQPLRVWRHRGRVFVAGQPGARYSLRLTNQTGGRVLAVVSVDGVNVVTGETAGYGQRGYVIGPYQAHDISGWRKSDTEVAGFAFAPLPKSYAARTGRPHDVGVVGVAAFRERVVVPPPAPASVSQSRLEEDADREASEVVVTAQRTEKLGTAHGARERSVATVVPFERATPYPQLIRQIEYDTYENLVALGVIRPHPGHRPRPFPSGGGGYAPDPPGRP